MPQLANQVAVVTGAGSGIGKSIALSLGVRGAALGLVGRRPKPLEAVAAEMMAAGAEGHVFPADLTREQGIRDLAAACERHLGRVDILVHCAAVVRVDTVANASVEDLDLQYRTNLLGPYLLTQCLLALLRKCQGQIVFINSSAGLAARAGLSQYAATKHALKAIADSLRDEVNGDGVRVLSVFPGRTATPTQELLHELEGRQYRPERLLQPDDVASVIVHALCLPRTAEVTEIMIRPMMKPE